MRRRILAAGALAPAMLGGVATDAASASTASPVGSPVIQYRMVNWPTAWRLMTAGDGHWCAISVRSDPPSGMPWPYDCTKAQAQPPRTQREYRVGFRTAMRLLAEGYMPNGWAVTRSHPHDWLVTRRWWR